MFIAYVTSTCKIKICINTFLSLSFQISVICELVCGKQPLATHYRGIRWNLQRQKLFSATPHPPLDTGSGNKCKSLLISWSNNYPAAASLPPNCLTRRSSLRWISPERAAAKLRNPSAEPACFRLRGSEVEQKWLSASTNPQDSVGSTSPNN